MSSGSTKAQKQAQQAEDQRRRQALATQQYIESIFSAPSREAGIRDVENATRDYLQSDLDRQNAQSQRQLKFALARDGQTGGSTDANQHRQLGEQYLRGALEVERRAMAAGNSLRQADQSSKLNLFTMAQNGLDMTTAARNAAESMRANVAGAKADALQSGLGDLFGDLGTIYKNSRERKGKQDAEKYQYNTPYQPSMYGYTGWGPGPQGPPW